MSFTSSDFLSAYRQACQTGGAYGSQKPTPSEDPSNYPPPTDSGGQDTYVGPTTIVAADEHARIWGDPHIVDADGGKYDFMEAGIYNVLEDEGVTLNARLEGGDGGPTYITESGLVVGNNKILIKADGTVLIDPGDGSAPIEMEDGETIQLGDGSYITKNGNNIQVGTPEYKIEFTTNEEHEGNQYMNIDIHTRDGGVMLDGSAPTGLLGETFDRGDTAQDGLKNDTEDYERDSLFETHQPPTGGTTEPPVDPPNRPSPEPPIGPPPTADTWQSVIEMLRQLLEKLQTLYTWG